MITGRAYPDEWAIYIAGGVGWTNNLKKQFIWEVFVMRIVTDPKALGKVCKELSYFDSKKIADDIIFWLRTHRRGKQVGAGAYAIACNQLGIDARVFLMKKPSGVWEAFINPEIIKASDDTYETDESCLSIPSKEFKVKRSQIIVVVAQSKPVVKYTGRDAIVIQHEIDHLNGILISDKEQPKKGIKLTGNMVEVPLSPAYQDFCTECGERIPICYCESFNKEDV